MILKNCCIFSVIAVLGLSLISMGSVLASDENDDLFWISEDETELVVQSNEDNATYYFNNDSSRLCYSFRLSGKWKPTVKSLSLLAIEEAGSRRNVVIQSKPAQTSKGPRAGVWIYSPEELVEYEGDDAVVLREQFTHKGL